MNSTTIITLAVAVLAVLGLAVVLTASRRSDVGGTGSLSRETRKRDRSIAKKAKSSSKEVESQAFASRGSSLAVMPPPEIEKWVAPDAEALGESRRAFLNRATVTLMSASLGGFAAALIAFLWKGAEGGFGSKISVGKIDDVIGQIRSARGFLYLPEARSWVTEYPKEAISKAEVAYGGQGAVFSGMNAGIVALYQKCPHLGCRVPECSTSQWFECPCHGSQYNRVGEKKGGPAPRGMDRFGVSVNNGVLVIDTGTVFGGPPIGTNTTGQEAEGPHCVGGAGKH
ncbi:MAG: ubiquinol-cytochrome c reductase iron-sulfur subunit [Actinobacteria bacterium]|nr:ubiquinol-cytochrome c reductase iron-sulfur subunit [Actinomycetota bacterium]